MQLTHQNFKASETKSQIVIACNEVIGPANIGALFRLSEAMGVRRLYFDTPINEDSRRMLKTSRETFHSVPYEDSVSLPKLLEEMKNDGFVSIALELTTTSLPISSLPEPSEAKWLLLIGNEKNGINESLLTVVDYHAHIPMFGKNSSMNVVQAAAMAVYELRRYE